MIILVSSEGSGYCTFHFKKNVMICSLGKINTEKRFHVYLSVCLRPQNGGMPCEGEFVAHWRVCNTEVMKFLRRQYFLKTTYKT